MAVLSTESLLGDSSHEVVYSSIERSGAERNILAYILADTNAIFEVSMHLREADFNNSVNRLVYSYMLRLMEKGYQISISSISAALKKHDGYSPEKIDEYLNTIMKSNIGSIDLRYNINLVKTASVKRQVYKESLCVMRECIDQDESIDYEGFIGKQQSRFLDMGLKVKSIDEAQDVSDLIEKTLVKKAQTPKEVVGYRTGFPELDYQISGLQNGRLYVVSASYKVGKSMLMTNWVTYMSILSEQKVPILYIDTEMKSEEFAIRVASYLSKIDSRILNNGMFSQDESTLNKAFSTVNIAKEGMLKHIYLPDFTPEKVAAIARRYKIQYDIGLLVFDYIKMPNDAYEANTNLYLSYGKVANTLKELANVLDIPVLTAAQLNREESIAGSIDIDRLTDYRFALRNKTPEEIDMQGIENGNQVLEMPVTRHGGSYCGWLNADKSICQYTEILNVAKE